MVAVIVDRDWKSHTVFASKSLRVGSGVLADGQESCSASLVCLRQALVERKRILTDGAADLEERENDWAFLEKVLKIEVFAVGRTECEIGSYFAGDECRHSGRNLLTN